LSTAELVASPGVREEQGQARGQPVPQLKV